MRAGSNRPSAASRLLALLELRQQRADAGRLQRLDDELVLGLAGKVVILPVAITSMPISGRKRRRAAERAPHDAGETRLLVLQVEIDMAGRVRLHRAKLRPDTDMAVRVLQRAPQRARELADRPFRCIDECCFAHSDSIKGESQRR